MRILVTTAVAAEQRAVRAATADRPGIDVSVVGVGPAAAAAATAHRLTTARYDLVVSAGVAGALPGRAEIGDVVVARRSIAADLGAETPEGFVPLSRLGLEDAAATEVIDTDPVLHHPDARVGDVLTVSTVTGTADSTAELVRRYPDAVAEAMEGFGVGTAARQAGVRFAELRTVSNLVGPRDRAAWRLDDALAALTEAVRVVTKELAWDR